MRGTWPPYTTNRKVAMIKTVMTVRILRDAILFAWWGRGGGGLQEGTGGAATIAAEQPQSVHTPYRPCSGGPLFRALTDPHPPLHPQPSAHTHSHDHHQHSGSNVCL